MVYTALSDDSNTVSQFTRRKGITITTGGTSTPSDYQVKLTIAYESEMQADFDDLRFNTKANEYIDYWIESYVTSTSAVVWIELPDAITDPGSDTIWLYYGNVSLSDGGVGDDTFEFFDNFPGASLDTTNKWTIINGTPTVNDGLFLDDDERIDTKIWTGNTISVRYKATYPNETGSTVYAQTGLYDNINQECSFLTYFNWDVRSRTAVDNELTTITTYNDEHIFEIKKNAGTEVKYYLDDSLEDTDTTYVPNAALPILFYKKGNNNLEIDWVLTRIYIANEPAVSYGSAQHQRRIPQFIG